MEIFHSIVLLTIFDSSRLSSGCESCRKPNRLKTIFFKLYCSCFQLFDNIKSTMPDALQKVVPVKGDITLEGLGLSDEDEAMLAEETSIVFHAAATINFQVG